MIHNIIKTIVHGSNTIYLDVSKDKYYEKCKNLNLEEAEVFTKRFLKDKGSIPKFNVKSINENYDTDNIEITIELLEQKKHLFFSFV